MEIRTSGITEYLGCKMSVQFSARKKSGMEYARYEAVPMGMTAPQCHNAGAAETCLESYYAGEVVYNRQYRDQPYHAIDAGSSESKSVRIEEYLGKVLGSMESTDMLSIKGTAKYSVVRAGVNDNEKQGNSTFTIIDNRLAQFLLSIHFCKRKNAGHDAYWL